MTNIKIKIDVALADPQTLEIKNIVVEFRDILTDNQRGVHTETYG